METKNLPYLLITLSNHKTTNVEIIKVLETLIIHSLILTCVINMSFKKKIISENSTLLRRLPLYFLILINLLSCMTLIIYPMYKQLSFDEKTCNYEQCTFEKWNNLFGYLRPLSIILNY